MDQADGGAAPVDAHQDTTAAEPRPIGSSDPQSSTSLLSDAPTTDPADTADADSKQLGDAGSAAVSAEPVANVKISETEAQSQHYQTNASSTNPPGWDAAKAQVMQDAATSGAMPSQIPPAEVTTGKRGARGRGGKLVSLNTGNGTPSREGEDGAQTTPASSGRGRGRVGRPRGRGRGRGSGRGGKRKREDRSDGEETSDSEVATPAVTMTKSGRNVQKPTSFVPPPPSPTTNTNKRKRTYRRNPESAVCKMCLRGTSPASNMIVFCDGCNTPYHRYCHQPPIDQAVIDEVDKEWYCKPCEKERIVPVPEQEVAGFVSAVGAPAEQRQKYFASLPPGMLVTLLTRATTLKPDLPLFGPDFEARAGSAANAIAGAIPHATPTNGLSSKMVQPSPSASQRPIQVPMPPPPQQMSSYADDPRYPVPDEHPAHYVRPGQGLMRSLPPDSEDLHYLVDDDRYQVFSHYHLDPQQQQQGGGHPVGEGSGVGGMGIGQAAPGA